MVGASVFCRHRFTNQVKRPSMFFTILLFVAVLDSGSLKLIDRGFLPNFYFPFLSYFSQHFCGETLFCKAAVTAI